ncbi:MAG: RidA family protein [SAR202 cluster bacterium]|nr:RidA family protein [SAR202 cluster bacterium]
MPKTVLHSTRIAPPAGVFSHGVAVPPGKMIFVSGQVARDLDGSIVGLGDITAQTRKVFQNIQAVLAEAGATMDDVVKLTLFVTNIEHHFAATQQVRGEFFTGDYPASTLVEVRSLVHEDMLVEIEAIAVTH